MQSKATTVAQYLAELPEDRRAVISAVRKVILANLDKGYAEGMQYGAIGYYVPHSIYPAGYHCDPKQPLPFAGLGSQKNHISLGLMGCYGDSEQDKWLRTAWARTGKKLDMGKCCIRFKRLEDVPLEVIGEAIRRMPAKAYIEHYEKAILSRNKPAAARRVTTKKTKPAATKTKPRPAAAKVAAGASKPRKKTARSR